MSGVNTSDSRKRRMPAADPVEIVADHLRAFGIAAIEVDRNGGTIFDHGYAVALVDVLRAEGLLA